MFNLYPNPTGGILTIEHKNGVGADRVILYDFRGRVLSNELIKGKFTKLIVLDSSNSGVYLVAVLNKEGGIISQRRVLVRH